MKERYDKARKMQPENLLGRAATLAPVPVFTEDGAAYRREWIKNGQKSWGFFCTDSSSGRERPLFDHNALAAQLEKAAGTPVPADRMELELMQADAKGCVFRYQDKVYRYGADGKMDEQERTAGSVSPNGKYTVYVREHNLWLRETGSGKDVQLTFDGELHWDYASRWEGDSSFISDRLSGREIAPRILWSPDGERFVTYKMDQRNVKELYLVQSVPPGEVSRPVLHTYKYCMPGDENMATAALYIYNVSDRSAVKVDMPDMPVAFMTPIHELLNCVCWSDAGSFILCYLMERGFKKATVYRIDPQTGRSQQLFEEKTDTFLFFDFFHLMQNENTEFVNHSWAPMWCSEREGSVLWLSNRSGWYQLYAYDLLTGALKNQVTDGEFEVCRVHYIDWGRRELYFSVMGLQEDPYDCSLCRCSLDGGDMTVLSQGAGNHLISFAPDGECYTDLLTESDLPPEFSLYRRDGSRAAVLTQCDAQWMKRDGFITPIRFKLPGADGQTPICGVLLLPDTAEKKVPIIDYYYGGTQHINTPHTFMGVAANSGFIECLVQLGAACVVLDGMGTPGRGKQFHDACYQRQGDCAGLEDHIAVIRRLCGMYPVLDDTRIGVWGHSGGGYAAFHCMTKHGDFYRCAVSSGGNHAQEIYLSDWSERFMGLFDRELWKKQNAEYLADKLKGPLLLIHGEMDDNVHPANTMRIVNALIQANKDFELLILPNYPHALRPSKYFRRRILDFFTLHLLKEQPPKEYCL